MKIRWAGVRWQRSPLEAAEAVFSSFLLFAMGASGRNDRAVSGPQVAFLLGGPFLQAYTD